MDHATKAAVAVLALCLVGVIWWCVRSDRQARRRAKAEAWAKAQMTQPTVPVRQRTGRPQRTEGDMGKHHGHHEQAVTVPHLLRRAVRAGDPLRLAWPAVDHDQEASRVRPYSQDEFPTAVLPVVHDQQPE